MLGFLWLYFIYSIESEEKECFKQTVLLKSGTNAYFQNDNL